MNNHDYQGQYAGFISRFIAFSLDLVVIGLISMLVTTFLGLVISFFGLDGVVANSVLGGVMTTLRDLVLLVGVLATSLFGLGYFLFFWVLVGFTPGMGLLGLRLVRYDGRPLTIGRALLRFIGYWVSALFLFVGFLWVIVDRRRQGWHDKLARTVVIYDWQLSHRRSTGYELNR